MPMLKHASQNVLNHRLHPFALQESLKTRPDYVTYTVSETVFKNGVFTSLLARPFFILYHTDRSG